MVLQVSSIDALVGGIAAAFFGGLLAAEAYLLKQLLVLKDGLAALSGRLDALRPVEESLKIYGDDDVGICAEDLKEGPAKGDP